MGYKQNRTTARKVLLLTPCEDKCYQTSPCPFAAWEAARTAGPTPGRTLSALAGIATGFTPRTNKNAVAQEQNTLLAKLYEYAKAGIACQLPPLRGSGSI